MFSFHWTVWKDSPSCLLILSCIQICWKSCHPTYIRTSHARLMGIKSNNESSFSLRSLWPLELNPVTSALYLMANFLFVSKLFYKFVRNPWWSSLCFHEIFVSLLLSKSFYGVFHATRVHETLSWFFVAVLCRHKKNGFINCAWMWTRKKKFLRIDLVCTRMHSYFERSGNRCKLRCGYILLSNSY